LADPDIAKTPFYLYLAGEAGTGKSYLVQTIIAAVKHINKKSGKNELEKASILVILHWWQDYRLIFSHSHGKNKVQ
jgi:ABC-type dipeptide/oligopeptide/nickel transport system ATPase component